MVRPTRGEVWLVDLGYAGKRRPCAIISIALQDEDNVLVAVVPRTTNIKGTRFETQTANRLFKPVGVFDAQMLQAVPCSKCEQRIGVLTPNELAEIETIVKLWLGLDGPSVT